MKIILISVLVLVSINLFSQVNIQNSDKHSRQSRCGLDDVLSSFDGDCEYNLFPSLEDPLLKEIPFYFAIPKLAHLNLDNNAWTKIPIRNVSTDEAYLRAYYFSDSTPEGRQKAYAKLFHNGIIQNGDVVLSFRPSWVDTVPYAHVQMGVSHSGIAYIENNQVKNLDMPLTENYLGQNFSSHFDSQHYLEAPYLHIIRPRKFDVRKKNNLNAWISQLQKNFKIIKDNKLLEFDDAYSTPKVDKYKGQQYAFVTTMARIILGLDTISVDMTMFCSEFTWAILSLANCSPDDPDFYDPLVESAKCVKPIFTPTYLTGDENNPGLIDGPLSVLKSLGLSKDEEKKLRKEIFKIGIINKLSPEHRMVAELAKVKKLTWLLRKIYYPASLRGNDLAIKSVSYMVHGFGRNYSPSSFLINSMIPEGNSERKFDYVATISFGQ